MSKFGLAVAALAFSAPLLAATAIDERRPLDANGRVSVNNVAGSIEVIAWERAEVALSGELGEDVEQLEISGDARALRVHVRYPRRMRGSVEETRLRLQVPRGAALELEGVSADITVAGSEGELSATSVSGDIQVRAKPPRVALHTVSGDIVLEAPAERVELKSVSGDIQARNVRGTLDAETVSGELHLGGGPFSRIAAKSVSGDLILDAALAVRGELRAETLSGEIAVRLAQPPDAVVAMKTFSGELRSDFAGPQAGNRRKSEQTLGAGQGRIELNSFSGDITLGRR